MKVLVKYIETQLVVSGKDYIPVLKKVIGRKIEHSGNLVGDSNKNPIVDTRIYEFEFPDGRVEA